ncbi:adenylate cyclase [Aliidongia dinghuensis]|uniref:Adenylate cyclase n=1 Tax=Aliidongia dinghuensis TaxID=1867774 RepID=A0A8J3E157_9PROT|nr:adenylate/guanylate cyclase domain-containing protein [Aliidongia dinghuensis]GGE98632.1 adenylate cyclase [Aliidongia dinghuensis]
MPGTNASRFEALGETRAENPMPAQARIDDQLANATIDWLIAQTLAGTTEPEIIAGLCGRLVQAGVPLLRVSSAAEVLHPMRGGQGIVWWRRDAVEQAYYPRRATPEGAEIRRRSPFDYLFENGLTRLRWRLDDADRSEAFPLFDELKAKGVTDYLAMVSKIDAQASLSAARDVAFSWAVDRPDGFVDRELALFERLAPALTFVINSIRSIAIGRTLLEIYLGTDAAALVLAGNVVRGQAERIRAAIWFSDLAGFTRMSDSTPPQAMLALLNDYAGCLSGAVHAAGGHVLKFMGDGILAIFRDQDPERACSRALDAALEALREVQHLHDKRAAAGLPGTEVKLALHFGELLYGNFGGPTRLDFTVLGPAVNEASRIVGLCGSLDRRVIVSSAFAEAAGGRRAELVSLGRYALKGVGRPQELFALDPEPLPPSAPDRHG